MVARKKVRFVSSSILRKALFALPVVSCLLFPGHSLWHSALAQVENRDHAFLSMKVEGKDEDGTEVVKDSTDLNMSGLPPVPESLANKLSRFTNFRSATIADWHPLSETMLIITNLCQNTQVHQVLMPGGARFQLTFEKDNVLWLGATAKTASYDPVKGEFFIFSKSRGGDENNQNYRYDFNSGKISLLTDGKSRNTPGVWSNSGRLLAYESNRRTGRDMDLYLVDPRDKASDRMLTVVGGGGWTILDWSPDDRHILVRKHTSILESYLWSFDATTGNATLLFPKTGLERIAYKDAQFSKDGKGLYVLTDKDSEYLRLAYVDIESGVHQYLSPAVNWDVDKFTMSKDRSKIAFTLNEDGYSRLYVYDIESKSSRHIGHLGDGIVSSLLWHGNGNEVGFSFSSRTSPHDVYSLDVDTDVLRRWTSSETGGINPETFDIPELVRWKSPDDVEFSGYMYKPKEGTHPGKRPVIIYFHGGPEGQHRPGFIGRNNYLINELGVAMVFPNVRGSTGYGKTFLKLDDGLLRANAYKDIKTVLDWVKTQDDLDPERVMLMGRSYGGYMSLAGAALYSDSIRCAVDVVGPSNLATFLQNTKGYRRNLRRAEYGDEREPKVRKYLERIAPYNRASQIKKPLLIIQGANDPRVPESESSQMVKRIKNHGVPLWYLVVKDAGHSFRKKPMIDAQFFTIVMFVKKYLLPEKEVAAVETGA